MWVHCVAVLGLGALCGAWILVQQWAERQSPGRGHRTSGCGSCAQDCDAREEE